LFTSRKVAQPPSAETQLPGASDEDESATLDRFDRFAGRARDGSI
jgi:hypothetical protein